MKRTNTVADALNTGTAEVDLGDGLRIRVPLANAPGGAMTLQSPNGTVYRVTVSDAGALTATRA